MRERNQGVGIVCAKGVGKFGDVLETHDEGVGIAVRDLKAHAEQHGEKEEDCHASLAEKTEGVKSQRVEE